MNKIFINVSLTSLTVFLIGWIMQAKKANIDTMPAERFDLIMGVYKTGNILITGSICLTAVAVVGWIAATIINAQKQLGNY